MKHLLLFLLLAAFQHTSAQNAQAEYDRRIAELRDQEMKAGDALEDKWYANNPNPQATMSACNDHCPKYYCRKHHKQCESACDCANQYAAESKALSARYTAMRETAENTFNRESAAENARAEKERQKNEAHQRQQATGGAPKSIVLPRRNPAASAAAAEENRQAQLALLQQQRERQQAASQQISEGIQAIADQIVAAMIAKDIRNEDASRNARFRELEQQLQSGKGTLVSCTACNGQGANTCAKCDGSAQVRCTTCFGVGTYMGSTCTACKGTGKTYCIHCNATGKTFCFHCSGTGKLYEEGSNEATGNSTDEADATSSATQPGQAPVISATGTVKTDLALALRDCLSRAESFAQDGDAAQAFQWYKLAADRDTASLSDPLIYWQLAQFQVGNAYRNGSGTARNLAQALAYYHRCADGAYGFEAAMVAIGELYEKGEGLPRDKTLAADWYQKAIARNFDDRATTQAQAALARLHATK